MSGNRIFAGVALGLCLLIGTGFGQGTESEGAQRTESGDAIDYHFSAEGISLKEAIKWATRDTGRSFRFNMNDIQNKPNLILSGPVRIPRTRSYEFWQSLFISANFAMVPTGPGAGDFVQLELIDSSRILKQRATYVPVENLAEYRHRAGEVIMTTIALKHIKVESVRGALQQMFTNRSAEFANEVPTANAILVVGFGPTVATIHETLRAMDVPEVRASLSFERISLKHAFAEQIQPIIAELIAKDQAPSRETVPAPAGALGQPGSTAAEDLRPKVLADPRSNALLVYATEADLKEIKGLALALDTEAKEVDRNIRVHRLKHSNAGQLAHTLRNLMNQEAGPGSGRVGPNGQGGVARLRDHVSVVAEEQANALLILASRTHDEELKAIIAELDQPRPEVKPEVSRRPQSGVQSPNSPTAKVEVKLTQAFAEVAGASLSISDLAGWIQDLTGLSVVVDRELRERWAGAPESVAIPTTKGLTGRELLALIADQVQVGFVVREYGLFMVPLVEVQLFRPAKTIPEHHR